MLIININKLYRPGMKEADLYKATRKAWKVGARREGAQYALAAYKGLCRGVYQINRWAEIPETGGRFGFEGVIAEAAVLDRYLGKSLEAYVVQGAQNPIKYVNC